MINILFGGNEKVFDGILLCLLSMTKHTEQELNIYILTADLKVLDPNYTPINNNQIEILNNVIKKKNPRSNVSLILMNDNFYKWINSSRNKISSYTPFAFLRLFADCIETLPEKVIYLDTDVMINGDIKELFDIDISNYELGVVKDRYGHFFIHPNYFNSGMLLMNMKQIKETKLLENVKYICSTKKMAFPDQSGLNKYCKKRLYLPRRFNEQGKLKQDTIVHHFSKKFRLFPIFHTVNIKPWQIEEVNKKYKINQYNDIYDEYRKIKSSINYWLFSIFVLKYPKG